MSKWGKADFSQFEQLAKNFQRSISNKQIDNVIVKILFELANRTLAKTKKRTPVGNYWIEYKHTFQSGKRRGQTTTRRRKRADGRVGGHLRRNWFVSDIQRNGDSLTIEIYNTVEYASYVENGHRTRNGGWVEGRFMLKVSLKEVEQMLPKIVERYQRVFFKELLTV